GSCAIYEGKTYETQWWANTEDVPHIGQNSWDSPWILSSDDGGNPDDGTPPDDNTPPDDGGTPPDNDQIPSQVRINWMQTNWASGQTIPFAWTLDWGTPGTSWELKANGNSIYQSIQFNSTTQTSQTGSTNLNLADGNYNLTVKLCTDAGCSESAATSIIVGANQSQTPSAPDVSAIGNINKSADIPVVWNMWW